MKPEGIAGPGSSPRRRWHRASLRRTLLIAVIGGLLAVLGGEAVLAWRNAVAVADAAYDRSLLGAIKAIDANISTASGGLGVEMPYRMLEFFQLTASGEVFFSVATADGLVRIGDAGVPPPPELKLGEPRFGNTSVYGMPVRMGSYARLLDPPLAGQTEAQRVIIQVAETRASRDEFSRALVRQSLSRDAVLIAAAIALLIGGVAWALRPLQRLRDQMASRGAQDMAPIDTRDVPAELQPLVDAINGHVARNRRLGQMQRRFVDDASHQLRTPLATLTTQLGYALRQTDPHRLQEALQALNLQLDKTVRQTNQMLALARTDSAELATTALDLGALAGDVARSLWRTAEQRGIDLGLEAPEAPLWVQAHAGLLEEALTNLLDNALRHTPAGGHVTVQLVPRLDGGSEVVCLTVLDDGPGIPASELAQAGERFFRASNAAAPGSGLGLAIARSIAQRHGGRLELQAGPQGVGLAATLVLPLAAAPAP